MPTMVQPLLTTPTLHLQEQHMHVPMGNHQDSNVNLVHAC